VGPETEFLPKTRFLNCIGGFEMTLKNLLTTITICCFICSLAFAYKFLPFSDLDSLMEKSELIVLAKIASSEQDKYENGLVKYEVIVLHNIRGSLPLDRCTVILQSDFIRKYHNFRPGGMALLFLTTQGSIGGKKVLMNCANSGSIMPASPDLDVKKLQGLSEKEQILFILKDYVEFKKSELRELETELPLPDIDSRKGVETVHPVRNNTSLDSEGSKDKFSNGVKINYAEMSEDIEIMSRIIDKTLKEKYKGEYYSPLLFGGRGCRGAYLEGYGVVFLVNVQFSVAEIQITQSQACEKEGLWEQTERLVRNQAIVNQTQAVNTLSNQAQFVEMRATVTNYGPEKVNQLKEELIRLIADYAGNIVQLKARDVISFIVFGKGTTNIVMQSNLFQEVTAITMTTLIIKVKKSDLDAHKAGKIDFKDFLKQAEVVQY
jgi:hypothetical protein